MDDDFDIEAELIKAMSTPPTVEERWALAEHIATSRFSWTLTNCCSSPA